MTTRDAEAGAANDGGTAERRPADGSAGAGPGHYLSPGLPAPAPSRDGLDEPYWAGLQEGRIVVQRCDDCRGWQWGPEWSCHRCGSMEIGWEETRPEGVVYSHQRVWHPVHPALADHGPYIVVLVELPAAGGVRVVGNLIGDPHQSLEIGAPVSAVFEHHDDADPAFTLLQWRAVAG